MTIPSATEFEANTEDGTARRRGRALHRDRRGCASAILLPVRLIDTLVMIGVWKRLVFGQAMP